MTRTPVAALWQLPPDDLSERLAAAVDGAVDRSDGPVAVYFRSDDVAVPGKRFAAMVGLFVRYRVPLGLAVVPAWLTEARWQVLKQLERRAPGLWCWHQHGWRHANHARRGKKSEFGPARPSPAVAADLVRGRQRLTDLMGGRFCPVFTPPWNRCSRDTLDHLKSLGYDAVSRSGGSSPPAPEGLQELPVHIDLHTRKRADAVEDWQRFFEEIEKGLACGSCGIMLHHQRMNGAALGFLDLFLRQLKRQRRIRPVHFKELIGRCHG